MLYSRASPIKSHMICAEKKSLLLKENLKKIDWSNKTLTDPSYQDDKNYSVSLLLPSGEQDINGI